MTLGPLNSTAKTMETAAKPDYGLVLKQMLGAIRRLEMYPPGHPAAAQAVEKPFLAMQKSLKSADHVIISRVEDKIIVNGKTVEGTDILTRLLEELDQENVNSLTFSKNLNKEELGSFLSFFVKPLGNREQTISLPDFIKSNRIRSIRVDQLRYELVNEDEVVVKSEIAEGAELKAQISEMVRDDPDLLREILLAKSEGEGDSGGGSGQSAGDGTGGGLGDEAGPVQLREEMQKQIKDLSDTDLAGLLASSLEQRLKSSASETSPSELNEVVDLVHQLLKDREKKKLLPEVKKILSERGTVQKEHLNLIFEEKWVKSQQVLDELVKMMDDLGMEKVDTERFMFLWHRVMNSGETEIIRYALDKALPKIRYQDNKIRDLVVSALEKALQCLVSQNIDQEFSYVRGRLCERIKDRLLPADIFRDCSRLLKMAFSETIRRNRFREANTVLVEFSARLNPETVCADGTKKIAQDFLREVTDKSTLDLLTSQMKEGVPFQNIQLAEEMLESLDGAKVAQKLLKIFTTNDRAARMSSLRVLSRLGKSSIAAFSALLSDPGTLLRTEGSSLLKDEQWHKVRNVIYVLGNIPDAKSIELLSKLSRDSDVRVRLEVVKALEKMGVGECADALTGMLKDQDKEVRKRVISSLSTLGDQSCLGPLMGHLRQTPEDARSALAAIVRIGGPESTGFLLKLLRGQWIGHLASRQKDEIRMAVFDAARQINSTDLADEIEKFVEQKGKGLKSLLVKDKVLESANRAVEAIRKRSHLHPVTPRQ